MLRSILLAGVWTVLAGIALGCEPSEDVEEAGEETQGGGGYFGNIELVPTAVEPSMSELELVPVEVELDHVPLALTDVRFLPGRSEFLALDFPGEVLHYALEPDDHARLLGRFTIPEVHFESECGLTQLAIDPDFETNHLFYLGHCISTRGGGIFRYELDEDDYEAIPRSRAVIIEVEEPRAEKPWHNIGSLGFDPQGRLWALFGDKTQHDNAQNTDSILGSVIRIIPDKTDEDGGYDVPDDNPFVGREGHDAVWAKGLRSPFRGTMDASGVLYIGDVGGREIEEIDVLRPDRFTNFGWSNSEGPCQDAACRGTVDPLVHYGRSTSHPYVMQDEDAVATDKRAVVAALVYEPEEEDRYGGYLTDRLLISDFCIGFVRALGFDRSRRLLSDEHIGHIRNLSAMRRGPDDWIYAASFPVCGAAYLDSRPTQLFRLDWRPREVGGGQERSLRGLLSEYEIYADPADRGEIDPRAFRYEPQYPLWSDGLAKDRILRLPEDATVDNESDSVYRFPVGTELFKTFSEVIEGTTVPVETRVMVRTDEGFEFGAYKWLEDGSDARLVDRDAALVVSVTGEGVGEVDHTIPSELMCRQCHETALNPVLGFQPLQLQGETTEGTWWSMARDHGVFTDPERPPPEIIRGRSELETQALGFFTGNCIHCHNGGTGDNASFDLRHDVAIDNTVDHPTEGSASTVGIRVIPGDPAGSVLFQAVSGETDDPELKFMPPLGVAEPSGDLVDMLRQWIASLAEPL